MRFDVLHLWYLGHPATPRYVGTVSKRYFAPPPKVDSAILHIGGISRHRFTSAGGALDETRLFQIMKTGFSHKRKVLVSNLAACMEKSAALEALSGKFGERAGKVRAEELSFDDWAALAS